MKKFLLLIFTLIVLFLMILPSYGQNKISALTPEEIKYLKSQGLTNREIIEPIQTQSQDLQQTTGHFKASIQKEWTVDIARQEAFTNAIYKIDMSKYPTIDLNLIENRQAINSKRFNLPDREITVFSDGGYSISYIGTTTSIFYDNSGKIYDIDEQDSINGYEKYPHKTYKYSVYGNLERISLHVSLNNSYMFNVSGGLLAHW